METPIEFIHNYRDIIQKLFNVKRKRVIRSKDVASRYLKAFYNEYTQSGSSGKLDFFDLLKAFSITGELVLLPAVQKNEKEDLEKEAKKILNKELCDRDWALVLFSSEETDWRMECIEYSDFLKEQGTHFKHSKIYPAVVSFYEDTKQNNPQFLQVGIMILKAQQQSLTTQMVAVADFIERVSYDMWRCDTYRELTVGNKDSCVSDIDTLFRGILYTTKDSDVKRIQQILSGKPLITEFRSSLDHRLAVKKASSKKGERNPTIACLLKNYTTDGSGQKKRASSQLKERYATQSFIDQKKILSAFLNSNKIDRKRACMKLYKQWDNSFKAQIKEVWKNHPEQCVAWVIVKYLPKMFVYEELNNLAYYADYWAICLKLGNYKEFKIDWEQLSIDEEFYVRAVLKKSGNKKELEHRFVEYIITLCDCGYRFLIKYAETIRTERGAYGVIDCDNEEMIRWIAQQGEEINFMYMPRVQKLIRSLSIMGMNETLLKFAQVIYKVHLNTNDQSKDDLYYKANALKSLSSMLKTSF